MCNIDMMEVVVEKSVQISGFVDYEVSYAQARFSEILVQDGFWTDRLHFTGSSASIHQAGRRLPAKSR